MDHGANDNSVSQHNNNSAPTRQWNFNRVVLFAKRRLKLNRFLLVIDTKKGVVISAITLIVLNLMDLLWSLSMTFGPLNTTMTSEALLLLVETLLVIFVSASLLYAMKTENKSHLRSILFTWLVVVGIDYFLRTTLNLSALVISEKASTTAKVMKSCESIVMLLLIAHCWLCVFTYYDDNNGKMTTVKITPSDDKGRLANKRQMIMMKPAGAQAELSAANLERSAAAVGIGANMLRAPTEDVAKSRW